MKSTSLYYHVITFLVVVILSHSVFSQTFAQTIPLGQEDLIEYLDQDLSGESTKRNLEFISRLHRMRGSKDYEQASAFIASKLEEYELDSIQTIKIPADGKVVYGTQKSRPAWNVEFAELWELEQQHNKWKPVIKVADWESIPMVLAQDSSSANVSAELIDIGAGTSVDDYVNKDVEGKLVLTSSQPGSVVELAIKKYGAVGIISYAQNQVTAWWKENENLIRWGHLDTFSTTKTFAFMVSLKQARNFKQRLENGESVRLSAKVIAQQTPGYYDILTAVISGADKKLKDEEIVFSCHLDHPRPGANDNASGCTAILEVARTLQKLIQEGKIKPPKRTIRFIWSAEIEATIALLNYKPDFASRIKFNIHMDMVGGGPKTKALFHVSRSPRSLPNFANDVGDAFGLFVNQSSNAYASGETSKYPIVSREGGKEALNAKLGGFHMGSDFQVYSEGSFKIPSIYLHDWPDRYIHTNYDEAGNIDPTKLKRSSFIGASSAYFIANLDNNNVSFIIDFMKRQVLTRASELLEYCQDLPLEEQENAKYYFWAQELEIFHSLKPYVSINADLEAEYTQYLSNLALTIGKGKIRPVGPTKASQKASVVYARNSKIKGPMSAFGYNYFFDHYDSKKKTPKIFSSSSLNGQGRAYSYEALNLVNGQNTILDIRNILSAQFGPIPIDYVIEYLEALKSINVINIKE